MSLDVYLTASNGSLGEAGTGIFIRENGQNREITRQEWAERWPGTEPVTVTPEPSAELFSANITHNLNHMAIAAGLYDCMWRPDEHEMTHAAQLIEPLRVGLVRLKAHPDLYRTFNPANGWGDYDGLVRFVENYLEACEANPDAAVSVSR